MTIAAFYFILTIIGVYGVIQGYTNHTLKKELRYMKNHLTKADSKIIFLDSNIELKNRRIELLESIKDTSQQAIFLRDELISNHETINKLYSLSRVNALKRKNMLIHKIRLKVKQSKLPKTKRNRIKLLIA